MKNVQLAKRIKGQGMTEYIIIVALIAIAAIASFTMFGDVVRAQVGTMTSELGGKESSTSNARVTARAAAADTQGGVKMTLKDYSEKGGEKVVKQYLAC